MNPPPRCFFSLLAHMGFKRLKLCWFLFSLSTALNFVAISEALRISPSVVAAGVAVDNVICALHFMVLFALASKIPRETTSAASSPGKDSLK